MRTIDPLDGPVDFSRFGPIRRNAFAGADEQGGPSLLAFWEMPQLATDAVHLPAGGAPPSVARRLLGESALIGSSAHSADEAVRAEAAGADFVVLGPIFETPSKRAFGPPIGLAELERAQRRCKIPLFGIGGITIERVREVRRAGAHGVAVVGSVMGARDVERVCADFLRVLKS